MRRKRFFIIIEQFECERDAMPRGGKPTGKEFFAIAQDLEAIAEGELRPEVVVSPDRQVRADVAAVIEGKPNVPLAQSDNENARQLVDLDQELTIDLNELSAAASGYARRRPFLLSEAIARECRYGYMPGSSKSSLRGQWVFGVQNEQVEPLAWIGRNVRYDEEYAKWLASGRHGREPMKYRFSNQSLFRRGLELYGQEFLGDERFCGSLHAYGIILVEGFTDRLRLHEPGVMSLAIMSNEMSLETPASEMAIVMRVTLANADKRTIIGMLLNVGAVAGMRSTE